MIIDAVHMAVSAFSWHSAVLWADVKGAIRQALNCAKATRRGYAPHR
jgi:hypothetical protein